MNAYALLATYYRMQAHAYNAYADHFAAMNNTEQAEFYRHMAQEYFGHARETEEGMLEDAA